MLGVRHYIISISLGPPGKKVAPGRKYLVSVWKSVDRKKHAVGLALGLICGSERPPLQPFSWTKEKVQPSDPDAPLGAAWLQRDEFEIRKLSRLKVKWIKRK